MRRIFLILICLLPAGAGAQQRNLSAAPVQLQIPGERPVKLYNDSFALVIGAAAYNNGWPRLPGVPGDVRAVVSAVRAQGFKVTQLLDPTLLQMEAALRKFIGEHGQNPSNRVLIYYAGHGYTVKSAAGGQLGYIVPVDAPLPGRNPGAFKLAAMSMEAIESYAKQIDAKHALFVFDSCFSGTFFKMRAAPESITLKTMNPVRQFITAGSADQEVPDVSVFRQQFLAGIKGEADLNGDGYVTGSELGMFLEDKVTNYSRQTQTPQYGKIRDPNLDKGDFVFALAPRAPRADAPPASAAIDPARVELEVWSSVKDSGSAEELNVYLEQYPKGQFAGVARARLKGLSAAPTQTSAPAPQVALAAPSSVVASPAARPGATFRDCDVCPEMIAIPAGTFTMGSPASEPQRDSDEGPQHQVAIARAFAAGKYEVTFDEWDACVRESGCSHNPSDSGWGRGKRPVINVSWDDAKQYVAWLSRKTGKTYRLLSEAEWEYVARAGTTTAFSFGNSISPQQANYDSAVSYAGSPTGTKEGKTVEVGRYAPNAFGLHDVHGNVWEWAEDCVNGSYAGAPGDGSAWTSGNCAQRVLRGGSWFNVPWFARSAIRYGYAASYRYVDFGLRVARTN